MTRLTHFIANQDVVPASGAWLPVYEPATGTRYAEAPDGDARDVAMAVDAARAAFPAWSTTPAATRSRILLDIADRLERRVAEFAQAESRDQGKPVALARDLEIPRAAANFRYFATKILHESTECFRTDSLTSGDRALNYVLRQPRGVVGAISPWNLPLYLFTWKIAPALATGNTVVAKPSEITPYTAWMFGELCREAKLPAGVLNIVHGLGPKVGQAIVAHPAVTTITFTGGTSTGAAIAAAAAPHFKKLSLELGGKNATIVCEDVDLESALSTIVRSAFQNQGEICLCGSRILVHRARLKEFCDRFIDESRTLKVGDPTAPDTDVGAIVSRQHLEKIQSYVALAKLEGGKVACGGGVPRLLPERCRNGWFHEPTVIVGLAPNCRTATEEIFGPVVSIHGYDTHGEAVAIANGTRYGLAASIWTRDIDRAHRMAAKIDSGVVWINTWMLRDLRTPFGGMKDSGVGREGGDDAMRFFTETKNVCVGFRES
ncbi:MAG: aldehyde dehydrogenase [Phycisphaerae bacterium]|nr:aldehyde dehydrogenase [Phycisphaerae bacterium]